MVGNYWKKLVGAFIVVAIISGVIVGIVLGSSDNKTSNQNQSSSSTSTSKPILMDIGSTSCVPCQMLQPVLDELEEDYGHKINIKFYDAWNSTAGANMANKYNVSSIPTLIFIDTNGNEVARMTGYQSYSTIVAKFKSLGWL